MMDIEDMKRVLENFLDQEQGLFVETALKYLSEKRPELVREWIDSNYCVTCPHFYDESEQVLVL